MSASTTQPMTGHANQAAPFGALAILVGALALGAVGIAIGQGYQATPASVAVPAINDRGLDSPLHKGSVQLSIQDRGLENKLREGSAPAIQDRALDGPMHQGVSVPTTVVPSIINGTATGVQQGLGGQDLIGRDVISGTATGVQQGLGGQDLIGRDVISGTAAGAEKTSPSPLRRGGHYRN